MAVFIASNTINPVKKRLAVNQAVFDAIGLREGAWKVSITESPKGDSWNIMLRDPDGFRRTLDFEGKECTPSHVGSIVRAALENPPKKGNGTVV